MSEKVTYDIKGSTIDELTVALEKPIIVFVGAGLSIPAPTCAPSWWTLTQELLRSFFKDVSEIQEIKEMGDLDFKIDRNPEEVFENFASVLGNRFFEVFSVLQEGRSNSAHIALARLMKKGLIHSIITTNFDRFIEEAFEEENLNYRVVVTNREFNDYKEAGYPATALLKIHGTVERPETIVSVASQYKTSKGFSVPKAEVFSHLMSEYECVFLGYSGWDYTHNNYRDFWQKASPNIKGIIWNIRPGETEGPPLHEIIPIDNLRLTEGDLPLALINTLNKMSIETAGLNVLDKEASDREFNESAVRRNIWFDNWVDKIPWPFVLGLTLTDIQNYSKEWQEYLKDGWKAQKQQTDVQMDLNQMIDDLMAKAQSGEMSWADYNTKVMELMAKKQETYDTMVTEDKLIKGTFDIRPVFNLLLKSIVEIEEQYIADAIDALVLSIMYISGRQTLKEFSKLLSDEAIDEINKLVESISDNPHNLEDIDKIVRNQFGSIYERCHNLNCDKLIFAKLELGMIGIWMQVMKSNFPEAGDQEVYVTHEFPSEIYQKIRKLYNPIIEELENFDFSYRQLIFSNLVQLAEAGDDLELAETYVKASLKETEGKITEATQAPIPEALGGFYDRREKWNEAISWYNLALEGLMFVNVRSNADQITYRAMVCEENLGNKKRALEIGFRYLSDYAGIEMAFKPVHKKAAKDMIARLVSELGYSSIEDAYKELNK